MRTRVVAVASGKGGTGKTTISTGLAWVAREPVRLLDCDVEEPNAHLFLKPEIEHSEPVSVPVPSIIPEKCTRCGECARACEYNALAVVPEEVLVFPELCHGCGGCLLRCPEQAVREVRRPIGVLERGRAGHVAFMHGRLNVGEAQSPPLIAAVKEAGRNGDPDGGWIIIDAPPGTSCPVIEAVRGAALVLLVTEPTPFGLNDLTLAAEMVRVLDVPAGVVINRSDAGDRRTWEYCEREGLPVLLEIPEDRKIAEAYSQGRVPAEAVPGYAERMRSLLGRIEETIG